jgi:1-acyl-sn-glycerol-3-phosphate acyltransferase
MRPPSDRGPGTAALAAARTVLAPWRWLTAPRFYGLENVPGDRPAVFVGNHTVMGLLDVPLMLLGLHEHRGVLVRPLGDHVHFAIPGWRDLLRLFGTVEGTREGCRALMAAGESILVFPGGGREVFKRKGEKYRLLWGNRLGFVHLAIEHGYPILPFAAVGAEECYDIVIDAGDLLRLVPLLRHLPRADEIPPLVRGLGLSAMPRPERFYFHFGQPIETAHLVGLETNERLCSAVRDEVRAAVEAGIAFLLWQRERDPERRPLARLLRRLRGVEPQPEIVPVPPRAARVAMLGRSPAAPIRMEA